MEAISTAGAGDALLAGTIAGLVAGLPLADSKDGDAHCTNLIGSAIDLGLVLAAFSLTSPHTIHPGATLESLLSFAEAQGFALSERMTESLSTDGVEAASG
jgi:sugar/nucleoside kinase (ribokinase family)